jgi:catechol 2,3-dioxygenase-like lactoylglutathione lyase family enzyme
MKPAFTHCALHVRDLDRSIAFYRSYCGLELVNEHGKGNSRTVWLASPGENATSCWSYSAADRRMPRRTVT